MRLIIYLIIQSQRDPSICIREPQEAKNGVRGLKARPPPHPGPCRDGCPYDAFWVDVRKKLDGSKMAHLIVLQIYSKLEREKFPALENFFKRIWVL